MNFAVPADHRIKLKESVKKDKYLELARELKKLWNMKVTMISQGQCSLKLWILWLYFQTIEINLVSSTRRVSGKLGLSQSNVIGSPS